MISAAFPYQKQRRRVLGREMAADPGAILTNDTLVNLVRGWPALTEKTVAGIHFVQEDLPDEIGRAIAGWMGDLQRSQQQHSISRQAG